MKEVIKKLLREGLFGEKDFPDVETINHGKVVDESIETKDMVLTLYRGVKTHEGGENPELIDKGDKYLLKVSNYPDELIWFTRDEDFANGYAGLALITYELPVVKHIKVLTYEDGFKENDFYYGNKDVKSAYGRGIISAVSTSNSPLYYGIELPKHWYWSYKDEKHIVCDSDLLIPKRNVKIN